MLKLAVFAKLDGYLPILFVSSPFHDKYFEIDEKSSCRIDESINPCYNTIHRLVWWVGWIYFIFYSLFSRKNCMWSPCFLFITTWFSLGTSGEITSWITLVCLLIVEIFKLVSEFLVVSCAFLDAVNAVYRAKTVSCATRVASNNF